MPVYLDKGAPCRVLEFDVAGLDEALEWAERAAVAERLPIEVRPFFEGDLDDAIGHAASDAQ